MRTTSRPGALYSALQRSRSGRHATGPSVGLVKLAIGHLSVIGCCSLNLYSGFPASLVFVLLITVLLTLPLPLHYVHSRMSKEVCMAFVLVLGLVDKNDVRRLEPSHNVQVDNDMADAEGAPTADGNAPINIKVSSSTHVESPRRGG